VVHGIARSPYLFNWYMSSAIDLYFHKVTGERQKVEAHVPRRGQQCGSASAPERSRCSSCRMMASSVVILWPLTLWVSSRLSSAAITHATMVKLFSAWGRSRRGLACVGLCVVG
jgi:hypothetical protein